MADTSLAVTAHGPIRVMRVLGAIILFIIGAIHLFLVFDGVGGTLGVLFVLNAVAGIVLAIGMLAARGRLFRAVAVLGLLFSIASLVALLLALTVGLFGITEVWTYTLVPETVVADAIGVVLLAVTTALVFRRTTA
jgi:hypothetical protein